MKKACKYCKGVIENNDIDGREVYIFLKRKYCSEECRFADYYKRQLEKWDLKVKSLNEKYDR
ncbi:MAG: hypothetical protein QXL18_05595 [Candidatus Woesearchaeota archaeon]